MKRFLIISRLDKKEIDLDPADHCYKKDGNRFLTVFLSDNVSDNDFIINGVRTKYTSNKMPFEDILPEDSVAREMVKDTLKMVVVGSGIIGAISLLPEDVSNWSDDKKGYVKNIKKGVRVDEDNVFINWIGHPYSGAAYYLIARHNGLSKWQSFGYSCLMSTFFWEFGLEAYFEQPSIQDLLITPIMGTLMGMVFESAIEHIEKNDGRLLGSKTLGGTVLIFMDPANPLLDHSTGAIRFLKSHGARLYIMKSDADFSPDWMSTMHESDSGKDKDQTYLGLFLEFKF